MKATRAAMEQVSLPAALDMAPGGAEGVKAKIKIATPNPVSRHMPLHMFLSLVALGAGKSVLNDLLVPCCRKGWMWRP